MTYNSANAIKPNQIKQNQSIIYFFLYTHTNADVVVIFKKF